MNIRVIRTLKELGDFLYRLGLPVMLGGTVIGGTTAGVLIISAPLISDYAERELSRVVFSWGLVGSTGLAIAFTGEKLKRLKEPVAELHPDLVSQLSRYTLESHKGQCSTCKYWNADDDSRVFLWCDPNQKPPTQPDCSSYESMLDED